MIFNPRPPAKKLLLHRHRLHRRTTNSIRRWHQSLGGIEDGDSLGEPLEAELNDRIQRTAISKDNSSTSPKAKLIDFQPTHWRQWPTSS
jgi:hypothetical protein